MNVEPGLYKHYKGSYYNVLGEVFNVHTNRAMVRYRPVAGGAEYVRDLVEFKEWVTLETCKVPRFLRLPQY